MLTRIISGGQTGADRGGLEAAEALGLQVGGHCPAGRKAEDGVVPARYPLEETSSDDYAVRTRLNVERSDASAIFVRGKLTPGSALTAELCLELGRPCLVLDLAAQPAPAAALREFLATYQVHTLNIAGSRESRAPGLQQAVKAVLCEAFAPERRAGEAPAGA